ncbi:MAG: thermosome subunit alpha [Nanoarchaeota archaeon]
MVGETGLSDNVNRTLGKDAQRNNIAAARIVADIVKTTLGPKGMDKMLVDGNGNIIVTNDGVTILEELDIEHPAAKMMVDIAKTQELEVGDGTTTAALLAGKLLENAEYLLDKKVHPTIIVKGYKKASEQAINFLKQLASKVDDDNILRQIAMTAMTGKGAEGHKEILADIIVNAVKTVSNGNEVYIGDINIEKRKGESISETELIRGIVIGKERANIEMPLRVDNAKVLLVDFPIELKNPETEAKISVSSPEQLEMFIRAEENYIRDLVDKIVLSGASVVFCQKGIDDVAQYYLAQAGIFACRRVTRTQMERLARATSAKIISNVNDVNLTILGGAEKVEEIKQGDESFIYIKGCKNPKAVTIVVRAGSNHVMDELERALNDGIGDVVSAVKSDAVVAGGGAIEMELSRALQIYAKSIGGKEQLAIEAFAKSLESIPETLAENAGLDPLEILSYMRKQHEAGNARAGLNLFTEKVEDTFIAGIIEPVKVKSQAIMSASEVATMILRIDDVLVRKPEHAKQLKEYDEDD